MSDNEYMKFIDCDTPEEVYARVRDWASDLSDHEHLVRSTILDIHADIERAMKQILYQVLLSVIFRGDDGLEYKKHCRSLEQMVARLNFATVHRILKPAFDAYGAPDLAHIADLQQVRNAVAHTQDVGEIQYKNRNPFTDPDCLAQLYCDGWAIRTTIGHFFKHMISTPRGFAKAYEEFYHENYARVKDKSA